MITNLDHDDLKKSRKALFVSSVTTIVISNAEIKDGPIKISEFELLISQATILFWLQIAVVYFLYIFVVRVVEDLDKFKLERLDTYLEALRDTGPEQLDNVGSRYYAEAQALKSSLSTKRLLYFAMSEAAPALLVAMVALTDLFTRLFSYFTQ